MGRVPKQLLPSSPSTGTSSKPAAVDNSEAAEVLFVVTTVSALVVFRDFDAVDFSEVATWRAPGCEMAAKWRGRPGRGTRFQGRPRPFLLQDFLDEPRADLQTLPPCQLVLRGLLSGAVSFSLFKPRLCQRNWRPSVSYSLLNLEILCTAGKRNLQQFSNS